LIGQRFPGNHDVKEALEGKIEFELAESKDETVSERAFQALSETYVPFFDAKGEVVGVLEVYQPVTTLNEEIQSRFQSSAMTALVFAAVAFGILVLAGWLLTKRERTIGGRA
jgi:sensor histidine kinase regulating citrate/malate metabolism